MLDNNDWDDDGSNTATVELLKLAGNIYLEEEVTASTGDDKDTAEDDDNEGWVDEREDMTEDELKELGESVRPVRLLLTKVRPG